LGDFVENLWLQVESQWHLAHRGLLRLCDVSGMLFLFP